MFDHLSLLEPTERSIILHTRKRTEIRNAIDLPPQPRHLAIFDRLVKKHTDWQVRLMPVGGYNCLGHVWASRRTGIFDDVEEQIRLIFQDDGYRVLDVRTEKPLVGDLVAYWYTLPQRVFLHIGVVVELRAAPGLQIKTPIILSKWDSTSGEVIHRFGDEPFNPPADATEFWTDRTIS